MVKSCGTGGAAAAGSSDNFIEPIYLKRPGSTGVPAASATAYRTAVVNPLKRVTRSRDYSESPYTCTHAVGTGGNAAAWSATPIDKESTDANF